MTSLSRQLLIPVLMFAAATTLFGQNPTRPATPTAPAASVSGKVTIKAKPAPGVTVGLRRSDMSNPYETLPRGNTDESGVYRINGIAPGSYTVIVMAPGFVVADSKNRNVALTAAETVEDVDFPIVKGGVITGKVTDAEGRPAVEQQVYIYRTEAFNQPANQPRRPVSVSGSAFTDDRGIYRAFGIAAGQYKVAVGRGEDTYSGSMAIGRTSYQQVFYPNVNDQTKATVIDVTEGSEATGIDINIGPPLQTFTATGRTLDGEKFMPIPNVRFGLQRVRGEGAEFMSTLITSNSQGEFSAEGLLPGKYSVFLMPEPNNNMRADALDFEIVDHDIAGLTVKLTPGAGISGVVVVENDDKQVLAKLAQMQLGAYVTNPAGGSLMGRSASSRISPDGSFIISGLPAGTANVTLSGMFGGDDSRRLFISRIERDGVVQLRGIEIKDGEQVAGLRVVVSYGTASLRGVVSFLNGELPPGGLIFVRIGKPGEPTFMIRPPQVDARGHFIAEGIPAGVYELSVSVNGPGIKPRMSRQTITLQDGVVSDVVVKIDLAAGTKP